MHFGFYVWTREKLTVFPLGLETEVARENTASIQPAAERCKNLGRINLQDPLCDMNIFLDEDKHNFLANILWLY